MKKILFITGSVILLLLAAAGVILLKARFFPAPAQLPENITLSPGEVAPGEAANYTFELTLPLGEKIEKAEVEGEDITASTPEVKFKRWVFDKVVWQISGKIRKLTIGAVPGAKIRLAAGSWQSNEQLNYTLQLPGLPEKAPESGSGKELILADIPAIEPAEKPWFKSWWFYTLCGVVLAAGAAGAVIWWKFRKKVRQENIPLDEAVIREIRKINDEVQKQLILPENGFAGICDAVRNYLEQRFSLPVTRQTTGEFLRKLAFPDSPLSPEEKKFLSDFMVQADMVKFAAGKADKELIARSASQAEKMIRNTAVDTGGKEK